MRDPNRVVFEAITLLVCVLAIHYLFPTPETFEMLTYKLPVSHTLTCRVMPMVVMYLYLNLILVCISDTRIWQHANATYKHTQAAICSEGEAWTSTVNEIVLISSHSFTRLRHKTTHGSSHSSEVTLIPWSAQKGLWSLDSIWSWSQTLLHGTYKWPPLDLISACTAS